MAGNPDFDAIASTTLKKYTENKLVDNIFQAMPALDWLRQRNRLKVLDGGASIVIPLMYGKNTTAGSYSGYDPLDITPQTGITAAEFQWKQNAVAITISNIEIAKNSGSRERVVNLLEAKTMQAEMSLVDELTRQFFSDGTGNSGKDWTGLAALVSDTGTLGGINRATETWWKAVVDNQSVPLKVEDMASVYNRASRGSDHPDLVLASRTLYEAYEALLQPQYRFTDTKLADAGIQNLKYKGATMIFDEALETAANDRIYFLNSKYLGMAVHRDYNFAPTPFVKPPNQDARVAHIVVYGNFWVSNCSRQGLLDGRTA